MSHTVIHVIHGYTVVNSVSQFVTDEYTCMFAMGRNLQPRNCCSQLRWGWFCWLVL